MRAQESKDNNKHTGPQGFEMGVMRGRRVWRTCKRNQGAVAVQRPRKEQLAISVPCDPPRMAIAIEYVQVEHSHNPSNASGNPSNQEVSTRADNKYFL